MAEIPTVENGGFSVDVTQWRIKLKPGVTWHDGARFTADELLRSTLEGSPLPPHA